ncbi:transposase family protein [Salinimicrobium tongyeongense]|uniref:Transposase family protein n=1 Tax=Salinimicrobium tongyeongense TaxID=2809707 RepID=A0ABY6NRF6_9FLAO|nr:DDE-type integrase/transposase/recombinase [Salinimicrobium tongyeongense]UZH55500.1 transposase family protein [Salinimicrobium tongyeongense]
MDQLYECIGISKQAVHQYARRQVLFDRQLMEFMSDAVDIRRDHSVCGVEKMYYTQKPDFIGRGRTTVAGKIYYPNKIKGIEINAPSVVWQSEIIYYRVKVKFYFAVFIIEVYTKKIVGYRVIDQMRGTANLKALKMALKDHKAPKIHHSDRGSQYTYKSSTDLLEFNSTTISMVLSAQDNTYAERLNRTIKEEYIVRCKPQTFNQLKSQVKKGVNNYNTNTLLTNQRIHELTTITFFRNSIPSI